MKKSVVITGVSSGFGQAAAAELLGRGYCVYGSVRRAEDAEKVTAMLNSPGFTPLLFDVTDHGAIDEAASWLTGELGDGGLAGLVNNAGVAPLGPLEHTPVAELRQVFDVNVFGVMAVTQAFLPLLKRGPAGQGSPAGRIINISSTSGIITFPMVGAYSASKYALESLNDALRRELDRYGIKVIAIEPGSIRTPIWDKTGAQDQDSRYVGTAYEQLMARMPDFFEQRLQSAKPISVVTKAVAEALEAASPRTRYPLDSNWYAGKHLADRLLDRVIRKQMPKG
jgi:NAD(P)-dependent dehydrogenase (short-subunit alcohol dehydrogenase family)